MEILLSLTSLCYSLSKAAGLQSCLQNSNTNCFTVSLRFFFSPYYSHHPEKKAGNKMTSLNFVNDKC